MNKGFCALLRMHALKKATEIIRNAVNFAKMCKEKTAVVRFAFSAMDRPHVQCASLCALVAVRRVHVSYL